MAGKPKKVSKREIWDRMDADTQAFIKLLTQPQQVAKWVTQKIPGTPYTERVQIMVDEQITLKAIKLEQQNIIWLDGHPDCEPKKSVDG